MTVVSRVFHNLTSCSEWNLRRCSSTSVSISFFLWCSPLIPTKREKRIQSTMSETTKNKLSKVARLRKRLSDSLGRLACKFSSPRFASSWCFIVSFCLSALAKEDWSISRTRSQTRSVYFTNICHTTLETNTKHLQALTPWLSKRACRAEERESRLLWWVPGQVGQRNQGFTSGEWRRSWWRWARPSMGEAASQRRGFTRRQSWPGLWETQGN